MQANGRSLLDGHAHRLPHREILAPTQISTEPNLNLAMIKGYRMPTPPLREQRAAVASIDAVAKARAEILQRREQAAQVKRELREEAICHVVQ